ncbi:Rpn family recombination-promoting nuclease/putative transposase [Fibrobacter sp. UWB11]|uniref:Rpn family recombination-promoting nuclease/putative transposase n=1 Tax=Fibrobacter sp. UWB11 TaxID=1896202 RepID=UPI00092B7444|nr:Rpn family recombination-promoting nuclease/putative transposase [Fibrobacter sp. UWB11]SIO10976.1 Putative transposase, YhgA-like [Fibrobacter sp. UWB11]
MEEKQAAKKPHDAFFRWLFADVKHLRYLLELAGKINIDVGEFLAAVNLDTLVRIPDSYSEVYETGDADLAFRVNVLTGAPVFVGILVEHKSGRDADMFNQLARYMRSVMKRFDEGRLFDGLPTMAMIFYNGRDNWNPLELLEKDYPAYFHGMVLPFRCAFVNMSDIPDSDCLACEDVATGLGIAMMAHAYDKDAILDIFNRFKPRLRKMPDKECSCLLEKISLYLAEYLGKEVMKELNMAFKSIGQKYGFVSAGDSFRQEIADAQAMAENAKAELVQNRDDIETVLREMGMSDEKIAEMQAKLEALRQSRQSHG